MDVPDYTSDLTTTTENTETTGTINITPNGNNTSATLTNTLVYSAINNSLKEAEEKGTQPVVEINMNTKPDKTNFSVTIPYTSFNHLAESEVEALTVSSPQITITFDDKAIDSINQSAKSRVTVSAAKVGVPAGYEEEIGDRPIYNLEVSSDGKKISSFGDGKATVSVKYTPAPGEDLDEIVIYYIPADGIPVKVTNCVYNPDTGMVTFVTNHFSAYAVAYSEVSFTDITGQWYENYVQFLASRGILSGTDKGIFSPEANITRAEFVTILARLSGADLSVYTVSAFSDVAKTDWYFAAVQWAFDKGLVQGSDGLFKPDANITRQDMAVLLQRYQQIILGKALPELQAAITFADSGSIASYASAAVTAVQKAGIISGKGEGIFDPEAFATRAEAAKMIAILLKLNLA
jgi:hypothetical protein